MKNKHGGWLISVALLLGMGLFGATSSIAGIATTKHNLSVTGLGSVKATSEKQVCVFCHTPHNAAPAVPLWNHALSAATYTPYSSRTMAAAAPGQPTGTSKLCLSCHDGTVAVGKIHNMPFDTTSPSGVVAGLEAMLTGATNLGTSLRDDHPISFTYDAAVVTKNPELADPTTLTGKVRLDGNKQVQCASCHDPHSDTNPKFLQLGYQDAGGYGAPLCRTCHVKQYWGTVPNMAHRESTRMWNGLGTNPWHIPGQNLANNANSTPKSNACESCHQPHAGTGGELLLKQDGESAVCLVCHNGNVATSNIQTLLTSYTYKHPIADATTALRHTIARQLDGKVREDQSNLANRHAECQDCHNPHAVSAGTSPDMPNLTNNLASNVLKGVWGVQPTWPANWMPVTTYTPVQDIQYQYQLCLKCHSYYAFGSSPPNDPYGKVVGGINTDQAKEFNPNNASYHPVVAQGKNPFIGTTPGGVTFNYSSSLINGNTPASTMTCAECHSAQPPGVAVPKGPHAAPYWPILYAPWDGNTGRTGTNNHICFQCHKYDVYANDMYTSQPLTTGYSNGGKNLHAYHVGKKNVPCIACHSAVPHGWKRRHLIVFGRTITSDPGADPAPYNSHSVYKFDGSSDYGIPSNVGSKFGKTLDTIQSGAWHQDFCHDGSPPISVGSCG